MQHVQMWNALSSAADAFERDRAPALRAYMPSKKGAKQERERLVEAHGQWLAQFVVEALCTLPTEGTAGAEAIRLLHCAEEAAGHVLTLLAYPSPDPEKLCYNVALRCHALRRQEPALQLSFAFVAASTLWRMPAVIACSAPSFAVATVSALL